MPTKRSRSRSRSVDFARAVKTARKTGTMGTVSSARRARSYYKLRPRTLTGKVNNLYKMIETKHFTWRTSVNVALPHNNVTIVQQQSGGDLNIFRSALGTDDPMGVGGSRIGDSISVRGVMIRGYFENALERPKVHYRVMLVRCAKGDTPNRANLFCSDSGNKMIDQVNNERFTIVAQRIFNISNSNPGPASSASATGVPLTAATSATWYGGTGTRTFKMWIPGFKFGNNGLIKFENASQTQVKFYDYRICIVAYN